MTSDVSRGIAQAYIVRTDLLVVALTGRTGSGCTTTADELAREFKDLAVATDSLGEPERRKKYIVLKFLEKQWIPFSKITVSTVIFSSLALKTDAQLRGYFKKVGLTAVESKAVRDILAGLRTRPGISEYLACAFSEDANRDPAAWMFYATELGHAAATCRQALGTKYAEIFQGIGDNLRYSGDPLSSSVDPAKLFTLIRAVKRLAKAAFASNQQRSRTSTRIVIDAIRNPLELVYLRDQFAAFYSIAISADDDDRRARLRALRLAEGEITSIDEKEYSAHSKTLDSYENFVSQNLQSCIQKSDIFFDNSGAPASRAQAIPRLNLQIVKYVALMLRPGLITPTRDERCMQLAFVAKLNSGCISRQVGAAVADKSFSIKAVGWNDVAKDQISCLLRDVNDLLTGRDSEAFSKFENSDGPLRSAVSQKFANRSVVRSEYGLPCPYCFKDAYNALKNENNQVHTRSLHAEENAFLQLAKYGNSGIEGGALYTTASPCELCSKKAFQLGVKEIVYVDPYPGISSQHILSSGLESSRPKLRLFSGAIGNAYHRLYEAILPIKDEYQALIR